MPSGEQQAELLKTVYAEAGVDTDDIEYFEVSWLSSRS